MFKKKRTVKEIQERVNKMLEDVSIEIESIHEKLLVGLKPIEEIQNETKRAIHQVVIIQGMMELLGRTGVEEEVLQYASMFLYDMVGEKKDDKEKPSYFGWSLRWFKQNK